MGFLSGTMSFQRYWISADPTPKLGQDHIDILEKFRSGKKQTTALEEPLVGFVAGSHLLDTKFAVEKNILGDAMHFGVRVDTDKIPAPIRNAWLQIELAPHLADNPSGKPTKAQRQEAKEAVEAKCQEEAASGKFRRMQQVPVLWDADAEVIYIGSTSTSGNETCVDLLERAFNLELDHITSGKLAVEYATANEKLEALYKLAPVSFAQPDATPSIMWWNGMSDNYDYLGNEFLMWLWWYWETKGGEITLNDKSRVSGMFARTLALDCPLGETGKESISAESPVALPEAVLAIQSGKLPRKAGLTLARNDEQYDLTLQSETFSIGSGKITQLGDAGPTDAHDRIASVRDFTDTVDFLYEAFCERRLSKAWSEDLAGIREWLQSSPSAGRRSAAA